MDQIAHNADLKAENNVEPVVKKQKTLLSLMDPTYNEEVGYVIFNNADGSKEKIFDLRILNEFSVLKSIYEKNKNSKVRLSNEYFAVLPFINMIFVEKSFNTSISKVINDGNFDVKTDSGIIEIVEIINFINIFSNGHLIENCMTKFPWLVNMLTDILQSDKIPDDYTNRIIFYVYSVDKSNGKVVFNLFDKVFKKICDNYISKYVKLSLISFGTKNRATIDINNIGFLRRLPQIH